jgi:hypothetical protein
MKRVLSEGEAFELEDLTQASDQKQQEDFKIARLLYVDQVCETESVAMMDTSPG